MARRVPLPAVLFAAIVITSPLLATRNAVASVTFTVNSVLDQPDDLTAPGTCHTAAGTCTLRAAVMQANRTSGLGATILLPTGLYSLTLPAAGADGEENGDLDLTAPSNGNPVITLVGAGASTTIIDASQLDRIVAVAEGRTAKISGVTLRNGYYPDAGGGALENAGTLTLAESTISDSQGGYGGGIHNVGTLTLRQSTISGNRGVVSGGGIVNIGTLTLSQCTISGNHSDLGGGIVNAQSLLVIDSTISGNGADSDGGGIYNSGASQASVVNVYNTTIVFNGADADADPVYGGTGGGVFNEPGGSFNLRNSLVAGNIVENAPVYDDCNGTLSSYGRNLIGELGEPAPCTINVGSGSWTALDSTNSIDILRDNGGPTRTHALLPGSNAIDGGDPTLGCTDNNGNTIATDQRGAPRVTGVRCDIGAFEVPEPASMAGTAVAVLTLVSLRRATRGDRAHPPV